MVSLAVAVALIHRYLVMISRNSMTRMPEANDSLAGIFRRYTPAEWGKTLEQFSDCNIYQTWAYGSNVWGANSLVHYVFRDSDHVRAIAQIRVVRLGPFGGIAHVRWGPCVQRQDGAWDAEAFQQAVSDLAVELGMRQRLVVRLIPNVFQEDPEARAAMQAMDAAGFMLDARFRPYRTFRVDLTIPLEQIRRRLDGKWRNQLNAAERNGLTVNDAASSELFASFRVLYEEMMARKRFYTTVDVGLFARMQEELAPSQKMFVAVAEHKGQLHAGVVVSGMGDTGVYLLGATGQEGLKSKASYLLQWKMMERLKTAGCRYYDLGGINPQENPGVYHFKSGMGGVEVKQLGRFELAPPAGQRWLLAWAERFQRWWRLWRNRWRA